ncbi:MAG: hypothetical protein QOG31_1894 [Thermoplasmata archaeon]|jgi:hypothetical protein|nr:hypothetical protein [Thermoplasmata archaeon]
MASERGIVESALRTEMSQGRFSILGRRKRLSRCYHLLRAEGVSRSRARKLTRGVKVAARRLRGAKELKEREVSTALDLILA